MRIEIPVHVQTFSGAAGGPPQFVARTLFFGPFESRHEQLERALTTLTSQVRKYFRECGRSRRHDMLCELLFSPQLHTTRMEVRIDLRKHAARGKLLFASCKALNRQLAFAALLPDQWFEVPRETTLVHRAQAVLSEHFQRLERESGDEQLPGVQQLFQARNDWITTLDFQLETSQGPAAGKPKRFALMGDAAEMDGDVELERVGRSLLDLYPDDLDRAVLSDQAVEELSSLLHSTDGRPVLLLGPRAVGKTTLLHEYVFQQAAKRGRHQQLDHGIWLLSPQRLISGMSFVGQWEGRVLAILKTAMKRKHLLYFDDLLGLFQAGKSAQSNLCVADVLKPYLERRHVRVIAETTPETWRVLREQDRSLSDLFRVLPINEPSEAESLRILLAVMMQLEGRHRCRFALDVLPTVLDLQRRYVRDAVMPGKAAAFLRRLAAKFASRDIRRDDALLEFQAQSGLTMSFLDTRARLAREEVLRGLRRGVIGQDQALSAVADVAALAKARLNDSGRPLASLLFLGPTGVGKTQTAKSLAAFLFGDADRLVRFDMNEFVSPDSGSRLVGTFHEPDGLLTGAIRRQPFAVLLFDEIEKAHSSVVDLLLQVLGEGRLTDAVGRTTDFTNTIIVLTSNLGVRRSEVRLGFDPPCVDDTHSYIVAAESYFRPEFFNRLDRIVPFSRLEKSDVRRIADLLLQEMLTREGLRRRRCALLIEPLAVDSMVELAFDPLLGARALRRGLERQVVRDVADQLVAGLPDAPTIIHVYPARQGVQVRLVPLVNAAPWQESSSSAIDVGAQVPIIRELLAELENRCDALRPVQGFQAGQISPTQQHYLSLRERLDTTKELLQQFIRHRETPQLSAARWNQPTDRGLRYTKKETFSYRIGSIPKRNMAVDLASAQDLHAYFQELVEQGEKLSHSDESDTETGLLRELALLRMLALSEPTQESHACLLLLEGAGDVHGIATSIVADVLPTALSEWSPVEATPMDDARLPPYRQAIRLDGPCSNEMADLEVGTHLVCPPGLGFMAVRVRRVMLPAGRSLSDYMQSDQRDRDAWLNAVAGSEQIPDRESEAWPPVIRIYDSTGFVLDVRSNTLVPDVFPSPRAFFQESKLSSSHSERAALPERSFVYRGDNPLVTTIRRAMQAALQAAARSWLEGQ